jgi:CLIP-associating protein 1/2
MNAEGAANIGILKLWLAKLTPLVHDKNTKLKEAAITCIISVYTHFDSTAVLNFILSLSVEDQNSLRRALKQYTPRIEVDLINYLQNKKERQRSKSSYDPSDVVGTSSEDGMVGFSRKAHYLGRYSVGSLDSDGGRKWSSQDSTILKSSLGPVTSVESEDHNHNHNNNNNNLETDSYCDNLHSKSKDHAYPVNPMGENFSSQSNQLGHVGSNIDFEGISTPRLDVNGPASLEHLNVGEGYAHDRELPSALELNHHTSEAVKINSMTDTGPSIPQILHMICNADDGSLVSSKQTALQQLFEASITNDQSVWTKVCLISY